MTPEDRCVVVITGASSGIGRATARAFAKRGDCVVLAARRDEMLAEVEQECRDLGGDALAVPTDVNSEEQVEALAQAAVGAFGRIDVWFNNAGVGIYGKFEDIPAAAWRQVIETNLFGCVHGARSALRQFRQQGYGTLINTASIAGRVAHPDASAYVASKFAVRGLSEGLRQELLDAPDIHVCTILPATIDTPFFQHAANYSSQRLRALPPVYPAEQVAETVVDVARRPRAEVIVGGAGKMFALQKRLMPSAMTRLTGRAMHAGFFADQSSANTSGNLFEPVRDDLDVPGGWRHEIRDRALPIMAMVLVAVPLGLLAWWAAAGRRSTGGDRQWRS